jgi:catechol 2,3-dioxygenase-like lactoylglutathione lyase family enzyme
MVKQKLKQSAGGRPAVADINTVGLGRVLFVGQEGNEGMTIKGKEMKGQVNVRYMVEDVGAAIDFYTKHLGFKLGFNASPAFADVTKGNLRLLLSGHTSSAGRPMPDGVSPSPGGWNRIELLVKDLVSEVANLKAEGLHFRSEIITGQGGSQILLMDPSGNFIELFQPKAKR